MWALLFIIIHILIAMVPLLIVFRNRIIFISICIAMLLLFSLFIIYDTKVIAGGEKYGLGVDDYIVGALLLYTVRIDLKDKCIGYNNDVYMVNNDSGFC
jgi:FtsH-binding integral membrane protein